MRSSLQKIFLLIFAIISFASYGQRYERVYYGAGALYNFQTEGVAWDARVRVPLYNGLYVSPRFSSFPKFNTINEYYAGADLGYQFMRKHRVKPYVYAAGYYDNWLNSSEFKHNPRAQKNNLVGEAGAGIIFAYRCLRPYIEYRYDIKWKEGSLGVGILFNLYSCIIKDSGEKKCPAFK